MMDNVEYFLNGIVSDDRTVGFMPHQGQIVAIDLSNGRLLWQSNEAVIPLATTSRSLVAGRAPESSNQLLVLELDRTTGKASDEVRVIEFPRWVNCCYDTSRFVIRECQVEDDTVHLRWEAKSEYQGGAFPSQEVEKQSQQQAEGTAELNLSTGRATVAVDNPSPVNVQRGADPARPRFQARSCRDLRHHRPHPNLALGRSWRLQWPSSWDPRAG